VSAALVPVSALASLADVVVQPLLNSLAALAELNPILVAYSLAGPAINLFGPAAAAIQNVVDAAAAGDLQGLVNAVLTAPGMVIDGVLNGGYGPAIVLPAQPPFVPFETKILSGGLLSLGGVIQIGLSQAPGPIATLMNIGKVITDALLTPPIAPTAETFSASLPQDTTETIAPQSKTADTSDTVSKSLVAVSVADISQQNADSDDAADAVEPDDRKTLERVSEQNVSRPSIRAVPAAETPADKDEKTTDRESTAGPHATAAHTDDDAPAANQADGPSDGS